MLNKAELIRKIIKHSGLDVADAKSFFEIFLSKIAFYLKPGEAIKLDSIGVFLLKRRNDTDTNEEELQTNNSNLYLAFYTHDLWREFYLTSSKVFNNDEGNLIFNIPNNIYSQTSPVDSYFSLSFEKPVIPLDISSYQSKTSLSPQELKKEYENYVNKLISSGELIENEIINSFTNIPTNKNIIKDESENIENVSWDFGEEFARELEEEEILDVEVNENDIQDLKSQFTDKYELAEDENENMSWEFGPPESEVIEGYESSFNEEEKISGEDELKIRNINKDTRGEFEEVKSLTTEIEDSIFSNKEPSAADNIWNSYLNENKTETTENASIEDDEIDFSKTVDADYKEFFKGKNSPRFTPVNNSELEEKGKIEDESIEDEDDFPFIKRKDGIIELQPRHIRDERRAKKEQEFSLFSSSQKVEEVVEEEQTDLDEESKFPDLRLHVESENINKQRQDSFLSKFILDKKPTALTWKLFSGFLIITMSYFIYQKTQSEDPNKIIVFDKPQKQININTQIIEREFEVPVTYPYMIKAIINFVPDNIEINLSNLKPNESFVDNNITETRDVNINENFTPPISDEENAALLFSKDNPNNKLNQKGQEPKAEEKKTETETKSKSQLANLSASGVIPDDTETSVVNNIFYDGSNYSVQVSSWPTTDKAFSEMERFKKMGYTAYVVKAYIPSRNKTFYRVRVGGFSSVTEAQSFNKR